MRAAGIPARVVVGHQGGEWNPYENYLLIKQYDAHAWAEVWLAGKGWVRYDPTFAVAPQRILDGFRETFEQRGENNLPRLSLDRYHNIALLNVLRLQIDRLNYNWVRWVLSYDSTRQIELMTSLFGEFSMARIAGIFVFASVLLLVLMYGFLLWQERDRTPDPVLRAYRRLCRRLARRGQKPRAGETPVQFLQRLAREQPQHYAHLSTAAVALQRYWYQSTANDA